MKIIYDTGRRSIGYHVLLAGVIAPDEGSWMSAKGFCPMTIEVAGLNATCHVCGSCELDKPLDSDHGIQIDANIVNTPTLLELTSPFNWIKVRASVVGGGSVSAYALGTFVK